MIILGIETSCDETGVALYDPERNFLLDRLHSQSALHTQFGGVVPELASRDHVRKILPLLRQLLAEAKLEFKDLDLVAYTAGPGLAGALLVGAAFAQALSFALKIPAFAVHHLAAHLLVPLLETEAPEFPFIALLVSGGHTQLVEVAAYGDYKILGTTVDDAAGEAFDKVAKVLQLPYPGGPALEKLAVSGRAGRFYFPRPMVKRAGLDFSFSGLKTYALNCFRKFAGREEEVRADIARAFQDAIVETLVIKCRRALRERGLKRLVVAGGVSANHILREQLQEMALAEQAKVYYPRLEFCTDNGAMVAYAGWRGYLAGAAPTQEIQVYPRWPLAD